MNADLILRSRARFARRLEGWQQAMCQMVRTPDSARALPDALLTTRKQDGPPKILFRSRSIDAWKVRP